MHLLCHSRDGGAQFPGKGHGFPPSRLPVIEVPLGDGAGQHFLQADRLSTELQSVCVPLFGPPLFVFDRHWEVEPLPPLQGDAVGGGVKFHHIAGAAHPEGAGKNLHAPGVEDAVPHLRQIGVVGALVHDLPFDGAQVFRPLLFDVDQGPLAAAEGKVLQSGEEEKFLFPVHGQIIRVQVTPAGSTSVRTSTW